MNGKTVQGWLTENSLVRRTAEALFRAASRHHLARLDRQAPVRCQPRILLGLLHQAQTTRFGREHDFHRIRTTGDFRRLVPLRTRADLWRQYWQPVYPHLAGATWPGLPQEEEKRRQGEEEKRRQGDKEKETSDSFSPSPPLLFSSSWLNAAHRRALRTALAFVVDAQPRARLLSGDLLFPGEEGPSSISERSNLPERLPALVRPFARMGADTSAERCAHLPVTCLAGPLERLLPLLENVKQVRGKTCVSDVWPGLTTILYTRRSVVTPVDRLRAAAQGVLLLEMAGRAEGPIAVEDPRHGLMRLLCDHGVYFEFVPPDQVGEPRCPRYGIDEAEIGIPYELVLTSPAGLWACRIGRTVCLESRDPPLLRFLDTSLTQPATIREERLLERIDLPLPTLPLPLSHPQNDDNPATLPESFFHSPWSARADRE
ncbi:MAG TPA: GH3 auxin-responsive promoter family protein [Gemmataceae bacterium]|nr:GH3 auxin-responsive promoter family protein [Gemmataceae bacterium]